MADQMPAFRLAPGVRAPDHPFRGSLMLGANQRTRGHRFDSIITVLPPDIIS
jgi:hypothetical protein